MSKLFTLMSDIIGKLNSKATLVNGKVPISQLPDNIGSGVNSWNDLEDKPFGEEKGFEDIIWDGNMEGLTSIPLTIFDIPGYACKVSDTPLTREQLQNATITASKWFIASITDPVNLHNDIDNDSFCINGFVAFSVAQANDELSYVDSAMPPTVFPEAGIWFIVVNDEQYFGEVAYTMALSSGMIVTKLDEKYLPDGVRNLPTVNTSDSGKFLCVDSDGNWSATTIAEWNGGSY